MRLRLSVFTLSVGLAFGGLAPSSLAQTVPGNANAPLPGAMRPGSQGDAVRDMGAERAADAERNSRTGPSTRRRGRPNAAEVSAGAQAAITAAGVQCTMTGATSPGQSDAGVVYEVSCADAPGLMILASTPPQTFNCLALDVSVANGGDPSTQCGMPANRDVVAAMKGYARILQIGCAIDQAAWSGRLGSGADRYEIGCSGAPGFWIEASAAGAPISKTPCADVVRAGQNCRFTTAEELAASGT